MVGRKKIQLLPSASVWVTGNGSRPDPSPINAPAQKSPSPETSAQLTGTPATPAPMASVIRTVSGSVRIAPVCPCWPLPPAMAIAEATGATGPLVNEEIRADVAEVVRGSTPELNLRRIGWIFQAREQMLEFNVPPLLALESMMVALRV